MIEKGGTEIADVSFFTMTEPFQDRRCVMECLYQFNFRYGKFFTGFQQNITGNAFISQALGQSLRHFFASTIGSS
jgi:hypothetical protein